MILSRQSGLRCRVFGSEVKHWSQITFRRFYGRPDSGKFTVDSGPGSVRAPALNLTDLRVNSDWMPREDFKIDRIRLSFARSGVYRFVRILECRSVLFNARGSLIMENDKLLKAHFKVVLLGEILKRLPSSLVTRMAAQKEGGRALQLVYSNHFIRLWDQKIPLFEATWQW